MRPTSIYRELCSEVSRLRFAPPVAFVYNPLDYARAPFEQYLERWVRPGVETVLLGMNPGPWGMAQTGVPFGEVSLVRDWLGIDAPVEKPRREHPKRPVLGWDCARSEVSGRRLWGWAKERFTSPKRFFESFFIANYCPLSFMEEGGRNITPDALPAAERQALERACDRALLRFVEALGARRVIGVGGYARRRAEAALAKTGLAVGEVLHPSPANPRANRGWAPAAEAQLRAQGIAL